MGKKARKILQLLLIAVCIVSTALLLRQLLDNAGGGESYDSALALATSGGKTKIASDQETVSETPAEKPEWVPAPVEDDPNMDTLAAMDLAALREVNPEVVGWIWVPDSNINYPMLQGADNDYYLKHTWDNKENSVGAIFLEHRSDPAFTDYNTIVYGHNMNDGSMFANLKRYSTEWYWDRHPYVYIALDSGVYRYEVFSSYQASVDSPAYGLSFHQDQTKVNFLTEAVKNSAAYTGVKPELTDRVLTLSTCSGAGYSSRWVVHARLKMVKAEA